MKGDGPLIAGPLPCGCVYRHPWYFLCPAARVRQTQLASAIKAGDTEEMHRIADLLAAHERGTPLPEAGGVAPLTKGGEG